MENTQTHSPAPLPSAMPTPMSITPNLNVNSPTPMPENLLNQDKKDDLNLNTTSLNNAPLDLNKSQENLDLNTSSELDNKSAPMPSAMPASSIETKLDEEESQYNENDKFFFDWNDWEKSCNELLEKGNFSDLNEYLTYTWNYWNEYMKAWKQYEKMEYMSKVQDMQSMAWTKWDEFREEAKSKFDAKN